MKQRGKFIVVEGADGSGKTTAAELLKKELEAQGKTVQTVNILKDDPVALKLRTILTAPESNIHPDAEACLYAGAVTNTYHRIILPLLEQGINVVADRNQLSTWAYQVVPQQTVGNFRPEVIFNAAYGEIIPDMLLLLVVDSQTGLNRAQQRDGKLDRLELRGVEYQKQVQQAYRNYCDSVSSRQPVVVYHNDGTEEELAQFITSVAKQI